MTKANKNTETEPTYSNYELHQSRKMWGNFATSTKYAIIAISIAVFIIVALIV